MILGQCMQVILYHIKHDPDWDNTSESNEQLTLLKFIEKKISAQTKDSYCYATVYNQWFTLYGFNQHNFINE